MNKSLFLVILILSIALLFGCSNPKKDMFKDANMADFGDSLSRSLGESIGSAINPDSFKVEVPNVSVPDFNITPPEIDVPSYDINADSFQVTIPDIQVPTIPEVEIPKFP